MPEITTGDKVDFPEQYRETLGTFFKDWIDQVEDDRRERHVKVWSKALTNYEAKPRGKNFPWPGASNASIGITPTHTNALAARHFNASIAHDPIHLVKSSRSGEVIPGLSYEDWSRMWQVASKYIEVHDLKYKRLAEQFILTFMIYGDAYIYLPWEREEVMRAGGEVKVLWDRPVPKVLHPKDVYINWWETDVQMARKVGIGWNLDLPTLEANRNSGLYSKADYEAMKKRLEKAGSDSESISKKLKDPSYFKEWGGYVYNADDFEKVLKREMGVDPSAVPNAIQMVRVFERIDLDGDGIPEEYIFDVDKETGLVPFGQVADFPGGLRPLVHFKYQTRPGAAYNQGIPELLLNTQKILDNTIRDIMDNNKVMNTKMFAVRKGSPISRQARAYPGKFWFVDNVDTDIKDLAIGQGSVNTSFQDLQLMAQWGEKITGVTDFNLGQERRSRTPATTTLALLEEGAKRTDWTISDMRENMWEMWKIVLGLYFKHGDPERLAKAAAIDDEDIPKFIMAWAQVDEDEFLDGLTITPEVSSTSLNKNVKRQEALVLYQQVTQAYDKLVQLAQAVGQSMGDPVMKELFVQYAKGTQRLLSRVLDTYEIKDQKELNPDLTDLIAQVTSVQVDIGAGGEGVGGGAGSSPGQAAQAMDIQGTPGGVTELTPSARPQAGATRPPGPTPAS
jgi:hypothetical protein